MKAVKRESVWYSQVIPLSLAFVSMAVFLVILGLNAHLLNKVFPVEPIKFVFRPLDLALGLYLYIKTSVDFAVFIGSMMVANRGWKNRVAVEWGTSLGNFAGTILILWIWVMFRSIGPIFEGLIVLIASFVLLELAAGSMERLKAARWDKAGGFREWFYKGAKNLLIIRRYTAVFLGWMPDVEGAMAGKKLPNFRALLLYSFTIPFILGSDDFASYLSVFNVVNVLSFASGVILGHGLLLAGMFAAPMVVERLMASPSFSALAVTTFFVIFGIGVQDGSRSLLEWGKGNMAAFSVLLIILVAWASSRRLRDSVTTGFSKTQEAALRLLIGIIKGLRLVGPEEAAKIERREEAAIHLWLIHRAHRAAATGWEKTRAAAMRFTRLIAPPRG